MSKTRVVEMLGEKGLVLPALLNAAILFVRIRAENRALDAARPARAQS